MRTWPCRSTPTGDGQRKRDCGPPFEAHLAFRHWRAMPDRQAVVVIHGIRVRFCHPLPLDRNSCHWKARFNQICNEPRVFSYEAMTIFGLMDIFSQAGRLWNRVNKASQRLSFRRGHCISRWSAHPVAQQSPDATYHSIGETTETDLLIVASVAYIGEILEENPGVISWIRRQYAQGARLASICTGVYLLAEAGMLDGKSATLHCGFTETSLKRYSLGYLLI